MRVRFVCMAILIAVLLAVPFWAAATTSYTDKLGLGMPEQGDVGWDDEIRTNHKIWEALLGSILDGHAVRSGATPTDGGARLFSWPAGEVVFNGQVYDLAAGVTTLPASSSIVWISAVTIAGSSGATVDVRAGEYYPMSSASGYYAPLALAKTAAGDIERLKDARYVPPWAMSSQGLNPVDDVRFNRAYFVDMADAFSGNIRGPSGVTLEGSSSVTPTVDGQVSYDTDDKMIVVGDGVNSRAIMTGHTVYVMVASPDLLDDETQPVWRNVSGTTFVITKAALRTSHSGTTLDLGSGASPYAYEYADATDILAGVQTWTLSGSSVYASDFMAGTTLVPPDYPVLLRYGGGSEADWLEITLGGYLEGNK